MVERRRLPPHMMLVLAAAIVSAYAISGIFAGRAERENLDACRDGVVAAAERPAYERPSAVARACAPLVRDKGCREAFAGFAASEDPARLGGLVRSCRDAYCERWSDPRPEACGVSVPSPYHAEALFARIFREEHGKTEDAAELGKTLAAALGAPHE